MPTQPPPSRYRVVEQGRRLVVIDTTTGAPAARSPAPAITRLPTAPDRTDFSGRSRLVTHPLYDAKAPRTLSLDEGATRLIETGRALLIGGAVIYAVAAIFAPWILLALVVVLNRKARAAARTAATRWLDRYDTGSSAG